MSETLPVTGAASTLLTALGAGLVAVGGFFVSFGRRLATR
ncbi:MAG: LPXTG cell wall anchor domain-containing protein [Acidimicrobiia bacterium]|nr:LPXTG cell wall anchor domain-containing protein [Acidimicrobiia bacterium]